MRKILYWFENIINSIKNLIRWFPIIWRDKDYDDSFIWEILKFKIRNQADYIGTKDRYVGAKRDTEIMMLCYRLIDDVQHEHYQSEYSDYHVSEHNWIPCDDKEIKEMEEEMVDDEDPFFRDMKGSTRMEITEISENFDEFFAKNKLMHKKAIEHLKTNKNWHSPESKIVQAMVISKLKHEKAINLLFKILAEHLQNWWD
jgi:hypothetical protein